MATPLIIGDELPAAGVNGSVPGRGGTRISPEKTPGHLLPLPRTLWALAAVAVAFALAYGPNFLDLQSVWSADPNYSHGYLIIPIALVILWRRLTDEPAEKKPAVGPVRKQIAGGRAETQPAVEATDTQPTVGPSRWWGWAGLCGFLALRAFAYERGSQWLETATLVPVIACLTWTFGSWPLLRRAWPAIAFLVFLFPLPPGVNDSVALPLQRLAATGSTFLLQMLGFWAVQQGNVIILTTPHGIEPLDVALACSGLRMLMTMAATITATIILINLPIWKRIVLLASTVPIAILSNMSRIVATGWCYYQFEGPKAKEWAHDVSGLLMMPVALALVGLELKVLSWLTPEKTEEEIEDDKPVLPAINVRASGKKSMKNADLDELA